MTTALKTRIRLSTAGYGTQRRVNIPVAKPVVGQVVVSAIAATILAVALGMTTKSIVYEHAPQVFRYIASEAVDSVRRR